LKRILITGGAGFIGLNLAIKLQEKGHQVRIFDNLSPQIHGNQADVKNNIPKGVEFLLGDVRNKEELRKAMLGQNIIVHLAAETGTGQSMYEVQKYTDTNICGTANVLDIIANEENEVEKFVIASSRAVYGEGTYECAVHGTVFPENRNESNMLNGMFEPTCPICDCHVTGVPTAETSKLHPSSVYGITKQVQEDLVRVCCEAIGIPYVVFRYQNVYGPGQSLKNPYTGILSIFSSRIVNNEKINIFEDGKESRDFVYIDDIVNATILGIENVAANNQIYNVGSGTQTSVAEVIQQLEKLFEKSADAEITGQFRLGDIRHNRADISKIQTELGYNPSVDFEHGIECFIEWVKTQEMGSNQYEKSLLEMKEKGLLK